MNETLFYLQQLRRRLAKLTHAYQKADFLAREVGERLLARLELIQLQPRVILDIGAGQGQTTRALQQRYPQARVMALDVASNMLPPKRSLWQRWRTPSLRAVCADAHRLPFATRSVDLIFSNSMLHQAYDLPQLLQEWLRVLKPGGLVLFSTFGPDTLKELRLACAAVSTTTRIPNFMDMHDIGDMLLQSHFADPVMDMECLTIYYESFQKLLREVQAQAALNTSAHRPHGLTSQHYWQRVAAAYAHDHITQQLPVTCEILYGHAWAPLAPPQRQASGEIHIPLSQLKRK